MRLAFITSTPTNIHEGSGTWSGIHTLAGELRRLGHVVEIVAPEFGKGDYTDLRIAFNESLRERDFRGFDLTVGFDMDGFTLGTGRPPHVASIKGVIADEMRFEEGATRAGMERQSRCEAEHLRRASLVMTTSRSAIGRLRDLYGFQGEVALVPEPLDLPGWKRRLEACAERAKRVEGFRVLCVCRLYPRKRVRVLLDAAAALRSRVPLEVRIVGDGPEEAALRAQHRALGLDGTVTWLGFVPPENLAAEYAACDAFCLPSVQEGFGIVFLEAMAAGRPIVASRASAVPEVVTHGLLAGPDDAASLAAAIERLARDPGLRARLAADGAKEVERYDAPKVAQLFLDAVAPLLSTRNREPQSG